MKGSTAATPLATSPEAIMATLDTSGILVDHESDCQPYPSGFPSRLAVDSNQSEDEDDDGDGEWAFSDVSSLRSYDLELSSEDEDGRSDRQQQLKLTVTTAAEWLTIDSGGGNQRGSLHEQLLLPVGSTSTWSSRSSDVEGSISSLSATTPSDTSGTLDRLSSLASDDGSTLDQGIPQPTPTATAARATNHTTEADGEEGESDSLGGSYADLEPSLYSDSTVSSSAGSRDGATGRRSISPPRSLIAKPGDGKNANEDDEDDEDDEAGRCELDFPDPANVSSSFTTSVGGGVPLRPTIQTFRSAAIAGIGSKTSLDVIGGGVNDTAATAGLLSFAMSGHNLFVPDATWGSFDTPTASSLLGPATLATTAPSPPLLDGRRIVCSKETDAAACGINIEHDILEKHRLLHTLPKRVRIILTGVALSAPIRSRLVDLLLRNLGRILDPATADPRVAFSENEAMEGETTMPVVRDLWNCTTVFGSGMHPPVKTSVKLDDLTRLSLPTTINDEETEVDRYIRSLSRLPPSSILVIHLVDLSAADADASADAAASSPSITLGLLRFTLSGLTGHRARVLTVDLSAAAAEKDEGVRPSQPVLTLNGLEALIDGPEAITVWGHILDEGIVAETEAKEKEAHIKKANIPSGLIETATIFFYTLCFCFAWFTLQHSYDGLHAQYRSKVQVVATPAALSPNDVGMISPPTFSSVSATSILASSDVKLTEMVSAAAPLREEPLTVAIVAMSQPARTSAPSVYAATAIEPTTVVLSAGCGPETGFPRFPGEGRSCSHVPSGSRAQETSPKPASQHTAEPIELAGRETTVIGLASPAQEPSAIAPIDPSSSLHKDPVIESVLVLVADAADTLLSSAALISIDNALALMHALVQTAVVVYEEVFRPSVARALRLAKGMHERAERVWKRVDSELWLAQRGVSRFGRTLSSLFNGESGSSSATRPVVPAAYAYAKPLSHTLVHELREVVQIASRSGRVVGRHGLQKGEATLRDARRGLEMIVRRSGELQREMRAKASGKRATHTAPTAAEGEDPRG